MNYFERQDKGRRQIFLLIGVFFVFLCLLCLLFGSLAVLFADLWRHSITPGQSLQERWLEVLQTDPLLWQATGFFFVLIGLLTAITVSHLARSGGAVAEMMGARPIAPETSDELEKRLRNVVEEMAIASGHPMPRVYVLRGEPGINAFASGMDPEGAAITVTDGALERLRRDELQAVVAHEMSHIVSRDVAMNVRVAGAVSGLMTIGQVGGFLLRSAGKVRRGRDGVHLVLLVGLVLYVIGWLGVLFGRILQSMMSREREFMADAGAIQFTRDPDALASALARIAFQSGSLVSNPYRDQLAHFFLAQVRRPWLGLFETHPPLEKRIEALNPRFLNPLFLQDAVTKTATRHHPTVSELDRAARSSERSPLLKTVMAQAGTLGLAVEAHGAEVIPVDIREALRDPGRARGAVFGLLLSRAEGPLPPTIERNLSPQEAECFYLVRTAAGAATASWRVNVHHLMLPTLRSFPVAAKRQLVESIAGVLRELNLVSVFEVSQYLHLRFGLLPGLDADLTAPPIISIRTFLDEVVLVFHWLRSLDPTPEVGGDGLRQALAAVTAQPVTLPSRVVVTLKSLESALVRLRQLPPAWKKKVIEGAWSLIIHDERIDPDEAEGLRVFCSVLGVPMPRLAVEARTRDVTSPQKAR